MKEMKKSSYSIYFFGIAFFLYGMIFPLYRLSDLLLATGVSFLAYALAGKVLPKEEVIKTVKDAALREAMTEADGYIEKIKAQNTLINDKDISGKLSRIISITEEIFDVALNREGEVKDVRRMLNYYLPTIIKLLDQYIELSSRTVNGDNIGISLAKISEMLTTIIFAFEKHLDGMYSQEAMDIDSEIMVLEAILTSEGLLEKENETIKLTLE
ncbi:MAG: 5-bromo-4-chloroindolyl phosphate hydrolysis family protein [Eubacteriaceae bacterium]|nr:5-bromo-4-chloroindolyl phosphate hydrolysis family protein [Eubacteriaceae bacterium]